MNAADFGHSSDNATRAFSKAGSSVAITEAGEALWPLNATVQSGGSIFSTMVRKLVRIACGSCVPTSRKLIFACAWDGSTVLKPSPV